MASLDDLYSLVSTLSKVHVGYLHWVRAFPEVFLFLFEQLRIAAHSSGPVGKVLITLNLAKSLWWLSHCKYWSVWVGFLYTVMDRLPSTSGFTMVSKKGIDPSSLLSSTVNFMAGSRLLMCHRKSFLLTSLVHDKGVIYKPVPELGGGGST